MQLIVNYCEDNLVRSLTISLNFLNLSAVDFFSIYNFQKFLDNYWLSLSLSSQ